MTHYWKHQSICDLCGGEHDTRQGVTVETGEVCCEDCTEQYVQFLHTDDDCFAFINEFTL